MSHSRLDVLAIGDLTTDAFIRLQDAKVHCKINTEDCELCVRFGDKVPFEYVKVVKAVGNAANAAVAAARLDLRSALLTNIGNDENGRDCLVELKKNNVSTEYVKVHKNKPTNYHFVLWYEADRTILVNHTAYDYRLPTMPSPKWVYLTSLASNTFPYHMAIADYLEANPDVRLAFQPGTFQIKLGFDELKRIYARTDVFVVNIEEAQRILKTDSRDLKKLMKDLAGHGPKIVIITDNTRGAYMFDGELNVANRGVMEMIEMLKVDPKFLYVLLTLAQEKTIKTERFPLIYADEFLIAHTNQTEYDRFIGDTKMEALHDRIIVVKFPYNVRLNEEVKIYDKLVNEADFGNVHIAPLSLKVASMFAVLSRLEPGKDQNLTLLKKMQLYNGEDVEGFIKEDIKNIKSDVTNEGMVGVSPRYIFNCIADCFTKYDLSCITPIDILRAIKGNFESSPKFTKDDISRFDDLLTIVVEEYTKMAKNEVQKAFFVNFEREANNLLLNYVDNINAFLDKSAVEDEFGEQHKPDENLMRSVEEKVGISESGKKSFRNEIARKVSRSDGDFDYRSHAKLCEAIQSQLFDERSDVIRLTVSSRNPDPEALEKINSVVKTLVEKHGYNHESANQLLRYVNSIMAKQ